MFNIKFWWNPREDDIKKTVGNISIRFSNGGKETVIDVYILDATYQEIITTFVLNTMLYHAVML